MIRFMNRLRLINILLIAALFLEAVPALARSGQDEPKVENVRVQPTGPIVYIYYDLLGPPQQVYEVTLTMMSKADSSFRYTPLNLTGEVGPTVFSGVGWRIAWNSAEEFPAGLKDDYYFDVSARIIGDQLIESGIKTEYLVAGGAVLVGGVLALILLNKKDSNPPQLLDFPAPPGRP